jgi:hypothetical protein
MLSEEELQKLRNEVDSGAAAQPDDEESEDEVTPAEESQTKEEMEKEESEEDSKSEEKEEARIPYSRFETVNERAIRAEQELQDLKAQYANQPSQPQATGDMSPEWVELYGDSDASKRAWQLQQGMLEKSLSAIKDEAAKQAVASLQRVQSEQAQQEAKVVEDMENAFTDFGAKNKRTFSDSEQSAILDIMDDFTPKNDDGKYIISPLSYLEKAVQFHDMQVAQASLSKKEARRKAVTLTSAGSEGEPSNNKSNDHIRAGDWDSWRNNPLLK